MNHLLKNTAKFALGTCLTLGAVTVAASVVAGKQVGKLVAAGFQGAKNAVEEELSKAKGDTTSPEEVAVPAAEETPAEKVEAPAAEETPAEKDEVSPADFEN